MSLGHLIFAAMIRTASAFSVLLLLATLQGCTTGSESMSLEVRSFDRVQLVDVFYAEGANTGDFNGDGITDLVYGPHWYPGPDFTSAQEIYPPVAYDPEKYSKSFFPHAYDFDEDGDQDLFHIGFPGEDASWFENTNGDGSTWERHIVYEPVDNESPAWTDLTGDGKPELVCITGGRYGYTRIDWGTPEKPWTFVPITEDLGLPTYTHGMGVGDVNGDGRMDVMEKDGWWEQPEGPGLWTRHPHTFGEGGAQMFAYDFDGDNDNDVFTSIEAHGWGLSLFENLDGKGDFFKEHIVMGDSLNPGPPGFAFSQPHALTLADINGDGIQDVVSGKRIMAHGTWGDPDRHGAPVTYWFETVRSDAGVSFEPHLISDGAGVGVMVATADVSGNGLQDIIVGNKLGAFLLKHTLSDP